MADGKKRTGYVFEEVYLWHDTGHLHSLADLVEPVKHWESPETKRRLHSLLAVSGLLDQLHRIRARSATREDLERFHTPEYIDRIIEQSNKQGGDAGDSAPFVRGAHEIACLSAGGVLAAVDAVMSGAVSNVYALVRPPGHHATAALGMGFCLYNNVALAALYLQQVHRVPKIAVVDYDVHCGNGTMDAFYDDDSVLVISLHQAGNYPLKTGRVDQLGRGRGEGYTVNVPLPPGSGSGAYRAAFDSVVTPALRAFRPDFILVSSGFDASYNDPLAAMILGSEDFRFFARTLCDLADELCGGRAVFAHEGGYSASYVPFCGVAVIEEMVGVTPSQRVADPFLHEVSSWEYQELQPHQEAVIARAAAVVRKYLVQPS